MNKIILAGDTSYFRVKSSDNVEIGHGMRLRLTFETVGTDHDWDMSILLHMHRQFTV